MSPLTTKSILTATTLALMLAFTAPASATSAAASYAHTDTAGGPVWLATRLNWLLNLWVH